VILRPTVPPPSTRAPHVHPALDAVVMRALELDPARRYSTAREMALHLEACVPAATQAEIGAWVDHCAHDALAARAACIAEIERREPSPVAGRQRPRPNTRGGTPVRPRSPRWRTIAGVGAASATFVAAVLLAVHAVRAPAGAVVAPAPAAAMTQSAAVPATAPAVTQPVLVTQEPSRAVSRPARHLVRSSPQLPAARPKRDSACDLGYVMDDKGHKIYQAQCFR
jgi:eukaryotic-like serine/threonine-protein kinase